MRFLVLLCMCATAVAAPQSSPKNDGQALLAAVREKVMQSANRLPRYMCTETIDRSTFVPQRKLGAFSCAELAALRAKPDWKLRNDTTDRLRLDVAISGRTEMYSWAGEDKFEDQTLSEMVKSGATSTGTFASFLISIFGTQAATFAYDGDVSSDGRVLSQFRYDVTLGQSEYRIGSANHTAVVPFDGKFLVDPKTLNLISLTVHADHLPADLNACEDVTTMNYSVVKLNDGEFLLPRDVILQVIKSNGNESANRTVFSACHEFLGKSSVSFDVDDEAKQAQVAKKVSGPVVIPAGLPFRISLQRPIDSATAAAGDAFQAELATAIKARDHSVLIPKGAVVKGRIIQIKRYHQLASQWLNVAVKLETIEAGGAPQPFEVRLHSVVKRRAADGQDLPMQQHLGNFEQQLEPQESDVGMLRFQNFSPTYVVPRGFEMEGETASHP